MYYYHNSLGAFHYWSKENIISTQELVKNDTAATLDIYGTDFSSFPAQSRPTDVGLIPIRVGNNIFTYWTKISNNQIRTYYDYRVHTTAPTGSAVQYTVSKNLALDPIPTDVEFASWGMWFPAIGANVGTPIESRNATWKLWSEIGGSSASSGDIMKREYTNALVLMRPSAYNTTNAQVFESSLPIDLGGTYYPLKVTGETDAPINSVQLKTGEGVVLMKSSIGADAFAPSAPAGLSVQ